MSANEPATEKNERCFIPMVMDGHPGRIYSLLRMVVFFKMKNSPGKVVMTMEIWYNDAYFL